MTYFSLWLLPALMGVASFHDGANCHNAVLAGQGYTNHLQYTDGIEMRYFLEHFCSRTQDQQSSGNILAVVRKDQLEHSAISMGDDRIFDKNSIAGRNGSFGQSQSHTYGLRTKAQSRYFANCGQNCHIEAYTCRDRIEIKNELRACLDRPTGQAIEELRSLLSAITLNPKRRVGFDNAYLPALRQIRSDIKNLKGGEECALYYLAASFSVNWHLWILNQLQQLNDEWFNVLDELNNELPELKNRIKAIDASPRTKRILAEFPY